MVPNPDSKQYWNNWKNDMSLFSATNLERPYKQSSYSTVSLYTTLSFPTGEYTLNSQIFVFPILALLVFINSICFIHTGKLTLFILSSQLDTECLGDFKGSIYSYIFTTLSQHYNQTNMKDIDYDNQTKW